MITAPLQGVLVPLVTPFLDGAVDFDTVRSLVAHYSGCGITGFVLLGTTGEGPTVTAVEQRQVVAAAIAVAGDVPVYVGVGGSSTSEVVATIRSWESLAVAGHLVVAPSYNRPSPDGLVEHFCAAAAATTRPVIAYNVAYRTGINLSNDALFEIHGRASNVVAVKDSGGDIVQSLDLLARAPAGLRVLTGEDHLYLTSLANGAAGGVLASAHLATATFVEVGEAVQADELHRARQLWRTIAPMITPLSVEANPMPLKHCLWRLGLLRSPECRLPLTRVSTRLAARLDAVVSRLGPDSPAQG